MAKTIKQIAEAMKAIQTDITDLAAKIAAGGDQAKCDAYKTILTEKQAEFNGLKAELDDAKTAKANADALKEAEDLAKTDTTDAGDMNPGKPADKGKAGGQPEPGTGGKAADDAELCKHACEFLQGKAIPMGAADALAPSDGIVSRADLINPNLTVMLPKSMVARILNPDGSKALLSTDSNNTNRTMPTNVLQAPDFRPQLIQLPVFDPMFYDMVKVIPAVNGKAAWPKLDQSAGKKFGGVAFTYKATEGADKGETQPEFTDFEIATTELSGWTELSLTLMNRSALALEPILTELFQSAARYEFSRAILLGTGTNQPMGILNATGIKEAARLEAGKIAPKDISKLSYAIPKGYRSAGCYIMDDSAEQFLVDLSDGLDRPLFRSSITDGPSDRLNGYRYYTHEFGPALGTKGDINFCVLPHYAFAVEEQIAIARSDHAEFKKGRVVFRMICFIGGKPIYDDSNVALS